MLSLVLVFVFAMALTFAACGNNNNEPGHNHGQPEGTNPCYVLCDRHPESGACHCHGNCDTDGCQCHTSH